MGLLIEENWVNKTEGYSMGGSGVYESFAETPGEIFRFSLKHDGRCTGKGWIDKASGPVQVGWVFEKSDKYEDTRQPYVRETWITLHERMPVTKRETFPLVIG